MVISCSALTLFMTYLTHIKQWFFILHHHSSRSSLSAKWYRTTLNRFNKIAMQMYSWISVIILDSGTMCVRLGVALCSHIYLPDRCIIFCYLSSYWLHYVWIFIFQLVAICTEIYLLVGYFMFWYFPLSLLHYMYTEGSKGCQKSL